VKQLDLDAFSGKQSIASVEQDLIKTYYRTWTNMEETLSRMIGSVSISIGIVAV
jgi:peptide/nickel transport system permease protein